MLAPCTLMVYREDNPLLSKTLVVNEWHYARFSMNGIPNGSGPSGIETKLLTHRYLEQKSRAIGTGGAGGAMAPPVFSEEPKRGI